MTLLDTLTSRARDVLRGFLGAVEGEDTPTTGVPPATPQRGEPLTSVDVRALRAMLDEHDRGQFLRSALLADLIRRDADVYGALQQRLTALGALPLVFDPADESDAAIAARDGLAGDWPRICPVAVQWDLWLDEILMGFALGQIVHRWDDERGALVGELMAWPASAVEHDDTQRQWYVHTVDRGRVAVTPGDGQWVLFAPRSARAPWMWGALRAVAEWALSNSYAASDGRRRSETTGQGIWKAKLPSGARESAEGKGFISSLRAIGRSAVIPVPQGQSQETSYDVELMEAKADAFRIFEWLKRTGGGSVRLAILGQDLTSQNNQVGTNASSSTGADVLTAVVEAQARGFSECMTTQVAAPRAKYLGEPLTKVRIDAEPEVDRRAGAEAAKAEAEAVQAWASAGVEVDLVKHAERAGMIGAKVMNVEPPSQTNVQPLAARSAPGASVVAPFRAVTGRPDYDPAKPYLLYRQSGRSCDECVACNGTTLPYNDPWWADHTPPLHPNCGCYVLAIPTPKYPNYAGPPVTVTPGWGTGVVPLSAADEAMAKTVERIATRYGIPLVALGELPRDGGSGRAYNPYQLDAGLNGSGLGGRWMAIGPQVQRASAVPWPEWDSATPAERAEAVLLHEYVEYLGGEHDDAMRTAGQRATPGSAAARILESQRQRGTILDRGDDPSWVP